MNAQISPKALSKIVASIKVGDTIIYSLSTGATQYSVTLLDANGNDIGHERVLLTAEESAVWVDDAYLIQMAARRLDLILQ